MYNGCIGCFANQAYRCTALSDRMDVCPFYKTPEELESSRIRAAKRLKRLVDKGLINPNAFVYMEPFIKAEIAKVNI